MEIAMEPVAAVTGLVQGYGRREVIRGLDLELHRGVLGLLGPNGAGKTTLLGTLATVLPPRRGDLTVLGRHVDGEADARRARRSIGYLPQDFGSFSSFSLYDFVRYCAWLREVPRSSARRATLEAIERVGLADRTRSRMGTLSGGMLRRAGIATALVGDPPILLLDEPTAGLDPAQRLDFRALIRSLEGTAVVLSTHLVEDVAAVCDDVVVLHDGTAVFRGSPAALAAAATPGSSGDTALERGYMSVLGLAQVAA